MLEKSPIIRFKPIFKEKIWGGSKIKSNLGFDVGDMEKCGEMWALSGVEGNESVVSSGAFEGNNLNELVEVYMGELVGDKIFNEYGNEFPILVKFIDANDKLSIQVHPDDVLAMKRGESRGKTEMWYIMDADKDAQLISGFKRQTTPQEYQDLLEEKKLEEILNFEDVKKDDVFYMPSGRIHAILPGIMLAEIQQTSDTTYRIYDWDRLDDKGNSRDLHIEEAMDAIDFKVYKDYKTKYHPTKNETVNLIDEKYFTTAVLDIDRPIEKNLEELDSFVIYVVTEGTLLMQANEQKEVLKKGDVVLLPAILRSLQIIPEPSCKLLEVYIKKETKLDDSALKDELGI